MSEHKSLAARLAEILQLPPSAGDAEILAQASLWASERAGQQTAASFAQRVADLVRLTNMTSEMAVQTLREQDRATAQNS